MTETKRKVRNAVVAFIGIFVILAAVIGFVDHQKGIEEKTKWATLQTLVEMDSEINGDVVKITYEYDPQEESWSENLEYSDGSHGWVIL